MMLIVESHVCIVEEHSPLYSTFLPIVKTDQHVSLDL